MSFARRFCGVIFALSPFGLAAQNAYTLIERKLVKGVMTERHIYRDNSRAVVDQGGARTLYLFDSHETYAWYPESFKECGHGTFADEWGDPFVTAKQLRGELDSRHAKQTGSELTMGIEAQVWEAKSAGKPIKAWVDPNTKLVLKEVVSGQTVVEITQLNLARPPDVVFQLPRACVPR